MKALPVGAGLLVAVTPAHAEEAPRWRLSAQSSTLGQGARRPMGLLIRAEVTRSWKLRDALSLAVGGALGVSLDQPRWMAALGGPVGALRGRLWAMPIELEGRVHLDFGRLPTCNAWGLCLNYSGFYPAFAAALSYIPSRHASLSASCGIRRISTLGWSGFSVEPAIAGTASF